MVVGVDSSHIPGRRTGVGMVASLNDEFTEFYNKIDIIEEERKERLVYSVSQFLQEAVTKYFERNKNSRNKLPSGIIIYRQGVSKEQKEFLKKEIDNIDIFLNGKLQENNVLQNNPIPFYYVLVNTKTTYKFFEQSTSQNKFKYENPQPGLLVMEDVVSPNLFEFFIQPQQVTGGTATPTLYHVAYGNINDPTFVPKLTFDLCYQYPNWQGPVRVPGPLKNAEKLCKMTAKYTKKQLHVDLRGSLAYL
jgi:hypothetical protein